MLLISVELRAQKLPSVPMESFALPIRPAPPSLLDRPHLALHHPHHRRINFVGVQYRMPPRNAGSRVLGEIPTVAWD